MNNFAVLNIAHLHLTTAIVITITTNNPCHLTCYYTDKEPHRHRTARNQRGLTLPWGVYYCFVAWKSVEQMEPGDTTTHTFEIPDWSFCQTKWFAFRGTVSAVLSPSVSPLFKHHHSGKKALFEHYNTGDDWYFAVYGTHYGGQTFTPLSSHFLTSVRLRLYRSGNPGDLIVINTATDEDGHPAGAPLALATIDANAFTTDPTGEWYEITFPTGYIANASTKYAVFLRATPAALPDYIGWRSDKTDPTYPRGNMEYMVLGETLWISVPGIDMMFEEYGIS